MWLKPLKNVCSDLIEIFQDMWAQDKRNRQSMSISFFSVHLAFIWADGLYSDKDSAIYSDDFCFFV